MMRVLCDYIDQLDLALDQLALKDRNFDRFAIMLVDNVVELTLHQHALDRQTKLQQHSNYPNFNPKALEAALGQKFDCKVAFAVQSDLLTKPMSQSINWLHSFRNSSYHAGLRHEGILHSLANFYFLVCCDLLCRYRPALWSFGSEQVSHRATKYLGNTDTLEVIFKAGEMFDLAWKRLRSVAENMKCNLVEDLARDLSNTIDHVDDQISFIASNAPGQLNYTRDQVVVDAQVWRFAFSKKGVQYAQNNGYPGQATAGPALASWLELHYRTPVPVDPIPGWKTRLRSVAQEKDKHKALEKYCSFITQTQEVREDISRHASLLDGYIQEQIDIARGK